MNPRALLLIMSAFSFAFLGGLSAWAKNPFDPATLKSSFELLKPVEKPCEGDPKGKKKSNDLVEGLFDKTDLLTVELTSDFMGKLANPTRDDLEQEKTRSKATLKILGPVQQTISMDVQRRGYGRGTCAVPLLKMDWKKDDPSVKNTLFDPLKGSSLKWVSECETSGNTERLMLEYLSQRWVVVSGFPHIRVRLAKVKYIDKDSGKLLSEGYGFFMEPKKDIEERYGVTILPAERNHFDMPYDLRKHPEADLTKAIPSMLIQALMLNHDYRPIFNKNTFVLLKPLAKDDEKKFETLGIYQGFLPYDMAYIDRHVLSYPDYGIDSVHANQGRSHLQNLKKVLSGLAGYQPDMDRLITEKNKGIWASEVVRYSKELLPKKDDFHKELKALPVPLLPNVENLVNDFFKALQTVVDQNGVVP
ncbi:MAG: hypothetical protein JNL01_13540 [Bdellovibrionales bacterium]|nr:hypothetical protein [Bdellovibrionales bacterium]